MEIILLLGVLVYSAILHEIMHGFVADRLGDPTARLAGRLTLNPLKHIDPVMSLLLPFLLLLTNSPILFGAAKPVPVDPFNLREGRKDLALVALSGPLTNILLAVCASIIMKIGASITFFSFLNLANPLFEAIINVNLLLAIFNLLPIPPLDGSKVFTLLLPEREAIRYLSLGQFGFIVLFFLLSFPIGNFSLQNFMYTMFLFLKSLLPV